MDARPKETPFHLGTAVKEKDLSKMNANNGPIRALPSRVANHIRASQVIGSIEQGVEELIQNAIIHGAARTVTVTVGTNNSNDVVIVIEDDGVGIENEAMRMLIGTEACCTTDNAVFGNQGRGDSLRSVAALCGETKIESTYMSTKGIVYSTKIIKNGVTVFFEDSASVCSIIPTVRSVRKTGMRITLNNMFQQFAVRRKQHRSEDLLASIRSMMSLLSLAYPLISFKLLSDGETGKVDSIFDPPKFSKEFLGALTCRVLHSGPMSVSLDDEVSALVERMLADGASSGRSIQLVGEDGDEFRLFGVIFLNEVRLDKKNCRKIQIFVNGRPAVQAKNLTEVIHYRIKKHFGDDSCESFQSKVSIDFPLLTFFFVKK
jgi:DNA mismatch repair ATPase MutL